jgi:hypothetical protein
VCCCLHCHGALHEHLVQQCGARTTFRSELRLGQNINHYEVDWAKVLHTMNWAKAHVASDPRQRGSSLRVEVAFRALRWFKAECLTIRLAGLSWLHDLHRAAAFVCVTLHSFHRVRKPRRMETLTHVPTADCIQAGPLRYR